MSLTLISNPTYTNTGPAPFLSNVAAAKSQLPYKFKRKDYPVISSQLDGTTGNHSVYIGAGLVGNDFQIGHYVFVEGANQILGLVTILGKTTSNIITSAPWTSDIGAGFCNLITYRADYTVFVDPIFNDTGKSILPSPEPYKTKQNGDLFVDVRSLTLALIIEGGSINYKLKFFEYYNGTTYTTQTDVAIYALPGMKQLLDAGGSNLWEYLPMYSPNQKQKQPTKFENPVTWIGWQTNVYYILDANYASRQSGTDRLGYTFRAANANKILIGTPTQIDEVPTGAPRIIKTTLPEQQKNELGAVYVFVFLYRASYGRESEEKYYEVRTPCQNAYMLEWINRIGINEQWLFEKMQEVSINTDPGIEIERMVNESIENRNDTLKRINGGSWQTVTFMAENLKQDQIRALTEIKESDTVWIWLDKTGTKRIQAVVTNIFATDYNTRAVFSTFTVSLKLPRNFDLFKNE